MSMTPGIVSRWLRSHAQAIEAAEGIRLVLRAKDETGAMVNVGLMDVQPAEDGYDFRELSRELVNRAAEGAPDAERIRLHLHLAVDGGRQEFSSKVFRIREPSSSFGTGTDAAVGRLLTQHTAVMELLVTSAREQYEVSVDSQRAQIQLVGHLKELMIELAHSESALIHTDRRTVTDRMADVAEAVVSHHFGVPVTDLAAMRGAVPALEGPDEEVPAGPRCGSCGKPGHNRRTCTAGNGKPEPTPADLLSAAQAWVRSMSPAELKAAIMTDKVIAPAVAEAWTTKA